MDGSFLGDRGHGHNQPCVTRGPHAETCTDPLPYPHASSSISVCSVSPSTRERPLEPATTSSASGHQTSRRRRRRGDHRGAARGEGVGEPRASRWRASDLGEGGAGCAGDEIGIAGLLRKCRGRRQTGEGGASRRVVRRGGAGAPPDAGGGDRRSGRRWLRGWNESRVRRRRFFFLLSGGRRCSALLFFPSSAPPLRQLQ